MFLEPYFKKYQSGWIEVICGSMFSGKTEELIRRLKRAKIANQTVRIFKPKIDIRYDDKKIVSHDANYIESIPIQAASEILTLAKDIEVIGVDEAQFMDMELVQVVQTLALKGVRVIIAGLDMDYKGIPFGPMPNLLAVAEYITKVHAICPHCGNLATHSYRLVANEEHIFLGEKQQYEPRCRSCYELDDKLQGKLSKHETL